MTTDELTHILKLQDYVDGEIEEAENSGDKVRLLYLLHSKLDLAIKMEDAWAVYREFGGEYETWHQFRKDTE